jgi:hypothetical protein
MALGGGMVLEEAVDLSCDRLLMNEFRYQNLQPCLPKSSPAEKQCW